MSSREAVLANALNQYWVKVARKINHDLPTNVEEETDFAFSWQPFGYDDFYFQNIFNSSFDACDDVIATEPICQKEKHDNTCQSVLTDDEGPFSGERNAEYTVDGASVSDTPIQYAVKGLHPYELPVMGTFVHPRITPGFFYIVRRLDKRSPMFDGKAVCLRRIGMGYGKRLTFAGESLHENDNYFWSDSNPAGYGFSLELVHAGDKFTVLDVNENAVGVLDVLQVMRPQKESNAGTDSKSYLRKEADVSMQCKVHFFEHSDKYDSDAVLVTGIAVAVKKPKSYAQLSVKVKNCFITGLSYTLVPRSVLHLQRSKCVPEEETCEIPIPYTIAGLRPTELPVIGSYVDPNIIPGLKYKVRECDSKNYLFEGKALTLLSIGRGYGKRVTFAGGSLRQNDNFFWSDSNLNGYALSLEIVSEGDVFRIHNSFGDEIGEAKVFKLCGPQIDCTSHSGYHSKMVKVSLSCHLTLGGHEDKITTRVKGIANVIRQERNCFRINIQHLDFPYIFETQDILGEVVSFVQM